MNIISSRETCTIIDANGKEQTTTKESTRSIQRNMEPDYIKLYTKMWCEFNNIPVPYRDLFLELVTRMTYCNSRDLKNSQLVNTGKPWSDAIMNALGWKQRMYQKGLRALCDCGAIRQVSRGVYQINPEYAGRGEWKYNPRLERGGVEDLVATFKFSSGTVDTKIVWADNGEDSDFNQIYREGLGVKAKDGTVLKSTVKTPVSFPDEQELPEALQG